MTFGWALLDLGRYEEARTQLEMVLKRMPDNLAAIRGLAELHDRSEHDEVAKINRDDSEWMKEMAAVAAAEAAEAAETPERPAREHLPSRAAATSEYSAEIPPNTFESTHEAAAAAAQVIVTNAS